MIDFIEISITISQFLSNFNRLKLFSQNSKSASHAATRRPAAKPGSFPRRSRPLPRTLRSLRSCPRASPRFRKKCRMLPPSRSRSTKTSMKNFINLMPKWRKSLQNYIFASTFLPKFVLGHRRLIVARSVAPCTPTGQSDAHPAQT